MQRVISLILAAAMICTMFVCLGCVTASAATTGNGLTGKQAAGFDTDNWTISDPSCLNGSTLGAIGGTGNTVTAESKDTFTTNGRFTFDFDLKFDNGWTNYYGEYVSVALGGNEVRIYNLNTYSPTYGGHYGIKLYRKSTLVASAYLGGSASSVNGHYTLSYYDGKFYGTVNGNTVKWDSGSTTADYVNYTPDPVNNSRVKVSIANNYNGTTQRYLANFSVRGPVNGDINGDGEVSSLDVLSAEQTMLGVDNGISAIDCDTNYDNVLSSVDILSLKSHVLGLGYMDHYERLPVNIMCIGDSITAGAGTLSAWRYSFFEQLYSAGADFRLVGSSLTTADVRLPEGYQGYSAVGGHTTGDVVNSLSSYMSNDFDVVAMMIGVNDYMQGLNINTTLQNYHTILNAIYNKNPNAHVYISTMCKPVFGGNDWLTDTKGVNPYLPGIAEEYADLGYNITYIDNVTGYNWSAADYPATDVVHPTEAGRAKIATAFSNAMLNDLLHFGKGIEFNYNSRITVSDLTLSDSSLTLEKGTAKSVTATVSPANVQVKTVLWSSSDPSVVTVSSNGRIKGVSTGSATVTARTLDGGIEKQIAVTVVNSSIPDTTAVFSDGFADLNNWTVAGGNISISGNTAYTGMVGTESTMTSKNTYVYTGGFELSFDYKTEGNENSEWDYLYGSVAYAGFEIRSHQCGNWVELYVGGNKLGEYKTIANIDYVNFRLVYRNGVATLYYDGEQVISGSCTAPASSGNIVYTHHQFYRNTSLDNMYLGSF